MARILETLEKHPLFSGVPREELTGLVLDCRVRTPLREDRVFSQGEPAEAFYIVVSGAVKLSSVAPGGREHVVEVMRPGESFALMPVLDGGRYPVAATALVDSTLVRVPRDAYRRLLARRPDLNARAAREIAERLRRMRARLEEVTTRSVAARVAGHLLRLAGNCAGEARAGVVVDLGATREVVANSLGTVREVFVRTIRAMEKGGIVAIRGRRVEILDEERLRKIAES